MNNKRVTILIAIFLLALAIRMLNFGDIFADGNVIFRDFDTYYHMRRIVLTTQNFPHCIDFDTYINYPYGSRIGWPPLYDQIIASLALLIGFGSPSILAIESVGAIFPVILGAVTIFPVYFIAKEIFDEKVGMLAALIFAIMPAHIYISYLGKPDHHVAEVFFSVMAFHLFMAAIRDYGNKKIKRSLAFSIISGIMMASLVLTWLGAPMLIGIIVIYVTAQFIINQRREHSSDSLKTVGLAIFLTTLMIITPVCATTYYGSSFAIKFMYLSWFHIILIALLTALFFVLGSISRFMLKRDIQWSLYLASIIVMVILLLIAVFITIPEFFSGFALAFGYIGRGGSALTTVTEAMPLFFVDGEFTIAPAMLNFVFSLYIAFIAFFVFIASKIKRKEAFRVNELFFVVWVVVIGLATFQQSRFSNHLAVVVAILCAYLFFKGTQSLKPSKKRKFLLFMIIFLIIPPNLLVGTAISLYQPFPSDDWYDSLVWMRENTPETSYYNNPVKRPEYGFMSWWDYGNWIIYVAQRAPVSNNFQTGINDSALFFTTKDEEIANQVLDKREVRYIVTDFDMGLYRRTMIQGIVDATGKFNFIARLAGENESEYFDLNKTPYEIYYETMYAKLHLFDGSSQETPLNDTVGALNQYRLIYESPNAFDSIQGEISEVKIFEYVRGAKIVGVVKPDTNVTISSDVITNQNRTFIYTKTVLSGENGSFEITVPYATIDTPYETKPTTPYTIIGEGVFKTVSVTEEEIINGAIISVELV
ncbi:MAG: oligosaccharyl transferase, archaeosortase A system-associated [Halobacteriota archaeon]|nr:oligosaccharyl transferase, archaeosortase A system-associated [Halobacteriota archaeon]